MLVGTGQVTNRAPNLVEPMDLMESATLSALADAGGKVQGILDRIDQVQVVNILAWHYPDPAESLAQRLALGPGRRLGTTVGGNTPQWLVSRACDDISAGRCDAVLVAGAEALDSVKRVRAAGSKLARGDRAAPPAGVVIGDDRAGLGPAETAAGLLAPALIYPLFESALAQAAGHSPDRHRAYLGRLMAPFTEVAARHPHLSWFPEPATAEELSTPSPNNRMVAEPYTKRLNSIIMVDQGAALILMSAEAASDAGVPRDRWVFPWAGAETNDVFLVAERPDLAHSPAIAAAGQAAMAGAGVGIDDVAHIDLYSCFPAAVQMGAAALGLDPFDSRGLTVTGGLAYFGGPGNNYATHSIALTMDLCRQDPAAIGLVSALGWFMTKHALGLYSATPPPRGWSHPDTSVPQAAIDATALMVASGDDAGGSAIVEASTVVHDRDAGPTSAPMIARLADGRRVLATAGPEIARALSGDSLVGRTVDVVPGTGAPTYSPT